jgi:hypothetical protein
MAENYDLIFGQSASSQYAWSDSDYQNGWQTVGSTPPTAEQFDALQRKSDTKAKDLNDRLEPLEEKAAEEGRQPSTAYTEGAMVTVEGLPAGWLLECVVAGNSGTDAITLPNPLIDGSTIIDGDVTWKLRKVATEGGLGYRQPSTTYTAGQIAYHSALPTGYYLECTTPGMTSSGDLSISSTTIGDTVTDGTVTWTINKEIGTGNVPLVVGYNAKQTFTSSGSFTASITGLYKVTLQGGGGGGAGSGFNSVTIVGGGGGGQGGHYEFYESLIAGTSYSFTIGAGGNAGAAATDGGNGGATNITINSNVYVAGGGYGGGSNANIGGAGEGGAVTVNNTIITRGAAGSSGDSLAGVSDPTLQYVNGGSGGGEGASAMMGATQADVGIAGGGGQGGIFARGAQNGYAGGDGYITFEWLDTSLL